MVFEDSEKAYDKAQNRGVTLDEEFSSHCLFELWRSMRDMREGNVTAVCSWSDGWDYIKEEP